MSYDFNKTYGPLPRLNQGRSPTCVDHTRALLLDAWERIWNAKKPEWGPAQVHWSPDPDDRACGYVATAPDGAHRIRNGSCEPGWKPATTPAEITALIRTNGIVECSVPGSTRSFTSAYKRRVGRRWRKPVIKPFTDDGPTVLNHDIAGVGVTKRGVIVQNHWGEEWGKKGRAVLSWAFIAKYRVTFLAYSYDGHPIGSLT